jgi:hypothetical protein
LLPILAALLLVGCANHSPEAEAQRAAEAQAQEAEGVAKDDAKCRSYGLVPGTPEFEKCLTKLADMRAQADSNSKAALAGRLQGRPPAWGNF